MKFQDKFALVNETTGKLCHVNSISEGLIASRSVCYKVKKYLSSQFPECKYEVYKLVRLGGKT